MKADDSIFSVRGRVACVTGASSGLGQRAATVLAGAGAKVVGVARRAEALEQWCWETQGDCASVAGDVADRDGLDDLVGQISAPFGAPDIVIHAAGLNTRQPADEVTAEGWDATIAINLSAPFFLSQKLVPAMREKGWGRIVNFASLQSFRAFPGGIAYGATKGGVAQLTRAMAEAWSKVGVTANAIAPGFFHTELTAAVFDDPERAARNAAQTCIGRNGEDADLDGPLLFLCSDASRYVTGQVMMLDGGVHSEMKALVYTGPEQLEFQDFADPTPADGEVIVNVESVGICGSDMHAFLGHDERRPAPLILGHEVAGNMMKWGTHETRVTVNPLVSCGECRACKAGQDNLCPNRQIISMPPREGGFAEQITMPTGNLVEVPDHVSADQAALAEPIACGWHAARIARSHPAGAGMDVQALVIGGGAIGLGAALSLKAQGVSDVVMIEPNDLRRRYLIDHCGQTVITEDDLFEEHQFDVVVDGVGYAPTRALASAKVRPGGVIVHIGLGSAEGGLDIRRATLQEITFVGTYTYTAQDFRDCAQAMFDGKLGALDWVETRPLSEGAQAFADIRAGTVAAPKIILKP